MSSEIPQICVCACTYKRPHLLRRLLQGLLEQETGDAFSYSVVIVDNDYEESAKSVTAEFAALGKIPIRYCVEPRQNIALARNRAIENASGEFVAFIDDDEFPTGRWLLTLFETCQRLNVDGVLGPVKPHFDVKPPRWVRHSKLYNRPTYPTGLVIDWTKGRTGNVLLRREVFSQDQQPFNPEFLTGEDQDFFRRMIEKDHSFVWCNEAVAYEVVPPIRWKTTFLLRKALLRGAVACIHPTFGIKDVAKSILIVPTYLVALPFALLMGYGRFTILLVKLFDHLGKLLACMGIRPVREAYVTE